MQHLPKPRVANLEPAVLRTALAAFGALKVEPSLASAFAVALASNLRVTCSEREHMAIYLRTFSTSVQLRARNDAARLPSGRGGTDHSTTGRSDELIQAGSAVEEVGIGLQPLPKVAVRKQHGRAAEEPDPELSEREARFLLNMGAFMRRDFAAVERTLRADVVMALPGSSWLAGTYRGYEQVSRCIVALRQVLDSEEKRLSFLHEGIR